MEKCKSYHEIVSKRKPTAFERGFYLAKTGEYPAEVIETKGYCYGTKDCEECECGGDQTKCDFYADVRKEARNAICRNAAKREKSEPKCGKWISVKRQKPPTNKEILVHTNKGKIFTYSLGIGEGFSDVTHWMPLPEPPKESED